MQISIAEPEEWEKSNGPLSKLEKEFLLFSIVVFVFHHNWRDFPNLHILVYHLRYCQYDPNNILSICDNYSLPNQANLPNLQNTILFRKRPNSRYCLSVIVALLPKQKRLQTPHTLAFGDTFSNVRNTIQVYRAFINASVSATQQIRHNFLLSHAVYKKGQS